MNAKIRDIRFIKDMTGVGLTTDWDVLGTDLGIPVYSPSQQRMYFLYGDTFGVPEGVEYKDNLVCAVADPDHKAVNWRGTIAGYTENFDLTNGIRWDGFLADENGMARELIKAHHSGKQDDREVTKICQGGIEIDGALYFFYESIRRWGPKGSSLWFINYCGAIKSTDGGKTFRRVHDLTWVETDEGEFAPMIKEFAEQDMNLQPSGYDLDLSTHVGPCFGQLYPLDGKDGYIYIYGRYGGRVHGIKVGRVKKADFETFAAYEYLTGFKDGEPVWVKGAEGLKILVEKNAECDIIPARTSNMSVAWNSYLSKWLLTYYKPGEGIACCLSDTPYGPYTEPEIMIPMNHPVLVKDSPDGISALYGGFIHELLSRENGRKIILVISQWHKKFYNSRLFEITFE